MPEIQSQKQIHSLAIRLFHWLNAVAVLLMLGSGWRIYNASPLFGFNFPSFLTLGNWLGGALQLHFAAMWLLMFNLAAYLLLGLVSGRIRRTFLPLNLSEAPSLLKQALQMTLKHEPGTYNSMQRLLYCAVLMTLLLTVFSGFAVWKPVQLRLLADAMGGYDTARYVHFAGMTIVVLFSIIHILMVALYPSSLWPMLTGIARKKAEANQNA